VIHVTKVEEKVKSLVEEISDLLGMGEDETILALSHFDWNPEKLKEQWFEDGAAEKILLACGATPKEVAPMPSPEELYCTVCYGEVELADNKVSLALPCNHLFCKTCWGMFLEQKLTEGKPGLEATCQ